MKTSSHDPRKRSLMREVHASNLSQLPYQSSIIGRKFLHGKLHSNSEINTHLLLPILFWYYDHVRDPIWVLSFLNVSSNHLSIQVFIDTLKSFEGKFPNLLSNQITHCM